MRWREIWIYLKLIQTREKLTSDFFLILHVILELEIKKNQAKSHEDFENQSFQKCLKFLGSLQHIKMWKKCKYEIIFNIAVYMQYGNFRLIGKYEYDEKTRRFKGDRYWVPKISEFASKCLIFSPNTVLAHFVFFYKLMINLLALCKALN